MAMRLDQCMRNRNPAKLGYRQIGCHEARVLAADPALQRPTGTVRIIGRQPELDLGEGMTELPETDREIDHGDMQCQDQHRMDRLEQGLSQHNRQDGRDDDQQPADHAVLTPAGVGGGRDPVGETGGSAMNDVIAGERTQLLQRQRQNECNETHG